jgi:hypothetical protein
MRTRLPSLEENETVCASLVSCLRIIFSGPGNKMSQNQTPSAAMAARKMNLKMVFIKELFR